MTEAELKNKVLELQEENLQHEQTIKEIARNMYRVIRTLGLTPEDLKDQKVAKKKALKAIPMIAMDATVNPSAIEEKFKFLGNFAVLFEENKHLIEEIAQEKEFQNA